jgi:AraC family transcriptional regulator, regulatory protein of adaptative response / DNA-3-methyladenine glycosylase II
VPRLEYQPPLAWDDLLAFLGARAITGIESVEDGVYRRAVAGGVVEIEPAADGALELRAPRGRGIAEARRLFDLDADPPRIASALGADPVVGPLLAAHPGVRVPGCWDGFELAVRAVLGQQVSVKGASTTAARLVESLGEPVETGRPGLGRLFPSPELIAEAELPGMPASRGRALRALAAAVVDGTLSLDPGADPAATVAALEELPGIGPWTSQYIAMRALADPDAYPTCDLGLRRALERLGAADADPDRWRPWRAYAAQLLWRSLSSPIAKEAA